MENRIDLAGYLLVMHDVLVRKKKILSGILEETKKQEAAVSGEEFDDVAFSAALDKKAELIPKITEMDDGFQKLYDEIAANINEHKEEHAEKIRTLQVLIKEVTDLSVEITTLEKSVKDKLDKRVNALRSGKKNFKMSRQTADRYYKSMNNLNAIDPVFMDQKH